MRILARARRSVLLAWLALCGACASQVSPVGIDFQKTLDALDQAQSHEEWESSPLHPIRVFQAFEEAAGVTETSTIDFCQRLQQLSDSDLSVFAEAIAGRGNRLDLPCQKELSERLGAYTERMEQKMRLLLVEDRKSSGAPVVQPMTFSPAPRFVNSELEGSIAHGDLSEGEFALTFDDGPHRTLTPRLLATLERFNVLASFFVVGQNVQALPEVVRTTYQRGHSIGTHSWSHANLPLLRFESAVREIEAPQKYLSQLLGEETFFFRFPFGNRSPRLQDFIGTRRWTSFLWNVDTLDWKVRDPEVLLKRVMADLARIKRGVVLFHDIQPQTIAMMPNLLYLMRTKGYRIRVLWPATQPFPRPAPVLP